MALASRSTGERSRIVELASGIDALYLSAWTQRPEWLIDGLAQAKAEALAKDAAVPYRLGGEDFELQPRSWRTYPYLLTFEGGRVGVNLNGTIPPFRFQPRAEWLHGEGASAVAAWFEDMLMVHLMYVVVSVSRIDLFADFEGLSFEQGDLRRFVGRARSRQLFEEDERWTGFMFGKRKSGTICARIYDKTEQLRVHRAGYWAEVWGRPIEGPPVTRVEFELTATALHDFGVRTPKEVLAAAGSLWAWLTSQWLSLRDPTDDETRSRWEVADMWHDVQRARLCEGSVGIERARAASRRADLRWHGPRLVGAIASVAALLGTEDLESTLSHLPLLVSGIEFESGRTFEDRVVERKRGA